MESQIDRIRAAFTKQSAAFDGYMETDLKKAFNLRAIDEMRLAGRELVLEVAAGTCAFGRMIAPHVSHITEFDVTEAMLSVGKATNEKHGVYNADYVIGEAERLPFADHTFDVVVSRLAFHHFADADTVFAQMRRVVKPDGVIVVADMLARSGSSRETADHYEALRDPSHVRCLSAAEFQALAEKHHCLVEHASITEIPMKLDAWMALTDVPEARRGEITSAMLDDIAGVSQTGFSPYSRDGEIMFNHRWLLLIARRP